MAKVVTTPSFNSDIHVKELNERFARLIRGLGYNNSKGTDRYNFETEFAYAIHEITAGPVYMQGKMFDKAAAVVNNLINHLKALKEEAAEA